jgi:hypothetical protein
MDTTARTLKGPSGRPARWRDLGITVVWIIAGVYLSLVGFEWVSRTEFTTRVRTLAANLLILEFRLATVTLAVDTLARRLVDQVLATLLGRNSEPVHNIAPALLIPRRLGSKLLLALILRLLDRISRTSLAPLMATLETRLIRPIGRLALVTGAMDPHPNILLNPFSWRLGGWPFGRLDVETVLLEQCLSTFGGRQHRGSARSTRNVNGSGSGRSSYSRLGLDRCGSIRSLWCLTNSRSRRTS